jgi:cytochrome c
MLMPV